LKKVKELFLLSEKYATDFDFVAQDIIKERELFEILGWENEFCQNQIVIGYLVRDYYGKPIKEFHVHQELEAFAFLFPPLTSEEKEFEKEYWSKLEKSLNDLNL